MTSPNYMTEQGMNKLKAELEILKNVERPKVVRQIAEARDKGDLSENAEYDAAKEAQGLLELKISQIEQKLSNARIISAENIDTSTVRLLTRVKVRNHTKKSDVEYSIVPDGEADFKSGKISVSTPIAKGLIGKSVGDVVEISIPAGRIKFEILEINCAE